MEGEGAEVAEERLSYNDCKESRPETSAGDSTGISAEKGLKGPGSGAED